MVHGFFPDLPADDPKADSIVSFYTGLLVSGFSCA
jgi:hypothetical protein